MRRLLLGLLLVLGLVALAGCGNKGSLVRPPAHSASTAPAASTPHPVAAAPARHASPATAGSSGRGR